MNNEISEFSEGVQTSLFIIRVLLLHGYINEPESLSLCQDLNEMSDFEADAYWRWIMKKYCLSVTNNFVDLNNIESVYTYLDSLQSLK